MPTATDVTEAAIALTFSEAFHGVQQRLQLDDDTINVRIPAGAKPGSRIRLKGRGRPSPFSQQRGDLFAKLQIVTPQDLNSILQRSN